jgi:hypothetical protein
MESPHLMGNKKCPMDIKGKGHNNRGHDKDFFQAPANGSTHQI